MEMRSHHANTFPICIYGLCQDNAQKRKLGSNVPLQLAGRERFSWQPLRLRDSFPVEVHHSHSSFNQTPCEAYYLMGRSSITLDFNWMSTEVTPDGANRKD